MRNAETGSATWRGRPSLADRSRPPAPERELYKAGLDSACCWSPDRARQRRQPATQENVYLFWVSCGLDKGAKFTICWRIRAADVSLPGSHPPVS
jgi:hypothetical protein